MIEPTVIEPTVIEPTVIEPVVIEPVVVGVPVVPEPPPPAPVVVTPAPVRDVRNLKFTLPIFTLLVSALQIAAHDRTEGADVRRTALDKLCNDYKAHAGL